MLAHAKCVRQVNMEVKGGEETPPVTGRLISSESIAHAGPQVNAQQLRYVDPARKEAKSGLRGALGPEHESESHMSLLSVQCVAS